MENDSQDKLLFQFYLVASLDHLGQRRALRDITGLPTNDEEQKEFIARMRDSVGRVLKIRRWFRNFFESAKAYEPNLNLVPQDLRDEFAASQKANLSYYGFSDSVIIAVPLMNDDENCAALNGIFSAFTATCGLGLLSLSAEIPIRGGLDVGIAMEIEQNEIYGPGFERSYFVESQLAEYPRYVLGKELIRYLYWAENMTVSSRFGAVAKDIATYCKAMIIRDADGRYMLDFLGEKAKGLYGESINNAIVINAYEFVKRQCINFAKADDHVLAARYYRLKQYFDHKLPVWNI